MWVEHMWALLRTALAGKRAAEAARRGQVRDSRRISRRVPRAADALRARAVLMIE
jgi:hypothetical protein